MYPSRTNAKQIEIAQSVCVGCPIRGWCKRAGDNENHGVWGGRLITEKRAGRQLKYFLTTVVPADTPAQALAEEWDIGINPEAGARQIRRMRQEMTSCDTSAK